MATAHEFELACPACDGPGIYAMEDGFRLRVGLTSNLSRFVRRQRTPVRLLYIVRLDLVKRPAPGGRCSATSELKGLSRGSASSRPGLRTMSPRAWPGRRGAEASSPHQTSAALRGVQGRAARALRQTEVIPWLPRGSTRARAADQASSQRSQRSARIHSRRHSGRSWERSAQTNRE